MPTYTYAVQDIARHFGQYLQWQASEGPLIADGRGRHRNVGTAHSIPAAYGSLGPRSVHASPRYGEVSQAFGAQLQALQAAQSDNQI